MNSPFDREVINQRERPISGDVNFGGSYANLALLTVLQQMFQSRTTFASDKAKVWPAANDAAFFGSAFKARALGVPAMTVTLDPGLGLFDTNTSDLNVGGVSGLNDPSVMKPLVLNPTATEATVGITGIPIGFGGASRLDYIMVAVGRFLTDSSSRDTLNPGTGIFAPGAQLKTLSYTMDNTFQVIASPTVATAPIAYKTGPAGGAAPTVDPGYVVIAAVNVPAAATTIANNQIIDVRRMLFRDGVLKLSGHLHVDTTPAQSMVKLECPPGVEACVFESTDGGGNAQANVFIKPGDARVFSSFSGILSVLGNIVVSSPANYPDIVVVASASGGDQASAAAASPPMQLATGQAFLKWAGINILRQGVSPVTSWDAHFQVSAQI